MVQENTQEKAPIIRLPKQEEHRKILYNKLEQCKNEGDRGMAIYKINPYAAPEEAILAKMQQVCVIAILERLFNRGEVNTWEIHRELIKKHGKREYINGVFGNVCRIIDDYCKHQKNNLCNL